MATENNQDTTTKDEQSNKPSEAVTPKKASKKKAKKKAAKKKSIKKSTTKHGKPSSGSSSNYPRHTIEKALRIPRAILEQNAGKECSKNEAAKFVGLTRSQGPFDVEVSSALKYGFLERPNPNQLKPTELSKKIFRPQASDDELNGYRQAVLNAPVISEVYKHYRGEYLPDTKFFSNALTETFKVPAEKIGEFIEIFLDDLNIAKLSEKAGDKTKILDIANEGTSSITVDTTAEFKKLTKSAGVDASDTCFVMMPFAAPLGEYYSKIYEPAIKKAGLNPLRADADIFGTGKIIDQIWTGINSSKVLIAELTSRNPNVFYESGLAHALKKPVVLICSNEDDVPFDLKHIRVIYYDMHDPFWGSKLIEKIAENILSAVSNPDEAVLFK
jgi:hypothetical protein